ncbi:MAG: IPT/TIG domain-containing protein [Acidobacteriaceae bacterium]|nr:IPT/TIG domain-containing protein [Acidobacteriaceae bacterium]
MSNQSPLIVPMVVEAFVVNDSVRLSGNAFMRAQMQYNAMHLFASGQPVLSNNDGNFTSPAVVPSNGVHSSDYYNGVYLKWRLPYAYTHGVQDNISGETIFPPVPNRWLVARYSGDLASRQANAWIVESDYQWPANPSAKNASEAACFYVGAQNKIPYAIPMGRNVALGSWRESGHSLGLTAVAPGNTAFAFYQPQNNNVFSFIDILYDRGKPLPAQTLSYMVFGWLSNDADDPLTHADAANFESILDGLRWSAVSDSGEFANRSLLYGSVNDVKWQTTGKPPGGAPTGSPVSIAVGNNSIEALTALITAQADALDKDIQPELLEAFQLDMIHVLDEPDGAATLAERLHSLAFEKYSGGYTWQIVDAPDANTEVSGSELQKEMTWLAALNTAQANLDEAIRQLSGLQIELYIMWWKFASWDRAYVGSTSIPELSNPDELRKQLDPGTQGGIAQRVKEQADKVRGLHPTVPQGDTPEALEASITAYAAQHDLPASRVLKRSDQPRLYAPNNPVVLIAGAGASGIVEESEDKLLCRFPSQLVTGFHFSTGPITASTPGLTIPQPNLSGVSGVPWSQALATALIQEFFFLDSNNATIVADAIHADKTDIERAMSNPANDIGTYPGGAIQTWQANPWHPLLLLWQATFYPIGYGTPSAPNWIYNGGEFFWTGSGAATKPSQTLGLQGLIQLSPTASLNMKARIKAFLDNNPSLDPEEKAAFDALLEFVETNDSWDLLSQALDGFNSQLGLHIPGVFISPDSTSLTTTPSLPELIAEAAGKAPNLGNIPKNAIPPSLFQPWRSGQFVFLNLLVVDEWGQALWPITPFNYKREVISTPPELTPVGRSNTVPFTIASGPAIARLTPSLASAGGGAFTMTINGAGFASGAEVEWNGNGLTTSFFSSTQITAAVPANLIAASGDINITVISDDHVSPPATFQVVSGPAIGSLSPSVMQAGMSPTAEFPLTVNGSGFEAGSVVKWNGADLETTYSNPTKLIAYVPAHLIATHGRASLTVSTRSGISAPAIFTIAATTAISSLSQTVISAGSPTFYLTLKGVGFEPNTVVRWNNSPLPTTYVDRSNVHAEVPAALVASAGVSNVTAITGHAAIENIPEALIQLPPALLQAARLDFDLISAIDDQIVSGGEHPEADPICGWVLPNHLNQSLVVYDAAGAALGEMAIGIGANEEPQICWTNAPNSPYSSLQQIGAEVRHFGPFLVGLKGQTPKTFQAFIRAIDETLWTTVPMGAVFDQSLAVLLGRPLAMARARVQFKMSGAPAADPSWQFTFAPEPPAVLGYQLPVELGNLPQLNDGLIGYFTSDQYSEFNVVEEAGATPSDYLRPIGRDNNYIYMPPDGKATTYISMLVDPRGSVHATTAILPTMEVALPGDFVDGALAALDVTFRVNGILTDQRVAAPTESTPGETFVLMPVPEETQGEWAWLEYDDAGLASYAIAPNDAVARLSNVAPVLRRGLLQLTSSLTAPTAPKPARSPALPRIR